MRASTPAPESLEDFRRRRAWRSTLPGLPRLVTISCRATTNPPKVRSARRRAGARLPARIDSFRLLQFVDQQHRNNPRLRNDVGEPFVEIHSKTARAARARW